MLRTTRRALGPYMGLSQLKILVLRLEPVGLLAPVSSTSATRPNCCVQCVHSSSNSEEVSFNAQCFATSMASSTAVTSISQLLWRVYAQSRLSLAQHSLPCAVAARLEQVQQPQQLPCAHVAQQRHCGQAAQALVVLLSEACAHGPSRRSTEVIAKTVYERGELQQSACVQRCGAVETTASSHTRWLQSTTRQCY
eukprot:16212-Heterococcus_DN1.PRE.5